jgi:formate dehydrogenase subunit gamma
MLATGSMLQWFRFFPVPWREGATFVHDVFALAVFVAVFGHIVMALTHPGSLRSIFTGWVSESWTARHAPAWLREEKEKTTRED